MMQAMNNRQPSADFAGVLGGASLMLVDAMADAISGGGQLIGAVGEKFALWHNRASQRRALSSLDARLLRDIGLDWVEVERELDKPFWRG
jgi:uncharacterized protein YjiS (DUF1127 family)